MKFHKETHASTTLTLYNFAHHYGLSLMCLPLFLLLLPATAQFSNTVAPPPPSIPDPFSKLKFDRNMAIIMVILVVVFFILGFLSVYTRQCTERRSRGRLELTLPIGVSGRRARGLNSEIIDTFPTFVYSTVKGRSTLECAVCLNEFEDDETLRLIPKCSHVFHPDCIGMWLASHSTCPLCRANLIPRPGEVSITIPTPGADSQEADPGWECEQVGEGNGEEVNRNRVGEECGNENVMRQSERRRAGNGILGRSHSTGHSLEGENWERFTLRLPEEVVKRTNSCVTFRRERTYRIRSAGERWGFTMRPSRSASNVGERSSDPLCPGNKD